MWLAWAFLSAFLLGFYDVCKKVSLTGNAVIPVLLLNTLFCTLFFLPLVIGSACGMVAPDNVLYIPRGSWETHGYIIVKAFIVLSSWYLGYLGLKHLPITLVGPIQATRPVMVLAGAVGVFGERLNLWQWAGVALAIVSFYMMSRSGKKEGIVFTRNKWVACIILAAVLGAASGLYDRYLMAPVGHGGVGLDRMTVQSWYNLYQFVLMLIVSLLAWFPRHRRDASFRWKWSILLISVFLTMADFVYLYALTCDDAMISVVSMVRRGSVVVSFAVGALLFRERAVRNKVPDLALVVLSMLLLWIGTSRH